VSTLYAAGKVVVSPAVRLLWRPKVSGRDNVPRRGPAILAGNHLAVIDSVILPAVLSRNVYFMAKDQYFIGTGLRGAVIRNIMYGLNQIPVDRSGGRKSLMALDSALPVLRDGNLLGIYPEGTRSPDGRLYRGRPGVAKLALDAPAPIIPIGLIGTDKIQPIGARIPRIGPSVEVRIGEPLDLEPWRGGEVDSRGLREVTRRLMAAIAGLTGQDVVNRYAPRRTSEKDDVNPAG
jgi:1-acyl-sn-glycerol-3-phosphate acyltransferase